MPYFTVVISFKINELLKIYFNDNKVIFGGTVLSVAYIFFKELFIKKKEYN